MSLMMMDQPVHEPTVEELIESVAAGDGEAEGRLFDRHQALMFDIARTSGLPADEVADCVQSSWVKAVHKLPQLRNPDRFAAWLAAITRNQARSQLRLHRRVTMTDNETLDLKVDCHAARFVVDQEDRRRLRAAIRRLDERDRLLIKLLFVEQRSYQEIAQLLGWSMGSIGPSRARMLRRLRNAFDELDTERKLAG